MTIVKPEPILRLCEDKGTPNRALTMEPLSQDNAYELIRTPKKLVEKRPFEFPDKGKSLTLDLVGANDSRETFLLDIFRGRIKSLKCSYNNRYGVTIILARIDINGPPHDNPDGSTVGGNHIHIYREGFGHKFAYELNSSGLTELPNEIKSFPDSVKWQALKTDDIVSVLKGFCGMINLQDSIQVSLQESFL